jgi:hypothetical protein
VTWESVKIAGFQGFGAQPGGIRTFVLLRAPGDQVTLRMRAAAGGRGDEILSHMLASFRSE